MSKFILEDEDFFTTIYWYCKKCNHKNTAIEIEFDCEEFQCEKCNTTFTYVSEYV